MARTAKKAPPLRTVFDELSRHGPHEVLHGDLSVAGLPGLVCTPRSGLGLPAVVFGHGWLQPPRRYIGLLRHLASWGIVAAAPGTQRGAFASHRLFTADLRTALDICANVRLGDGDISVDPDRMGAAGHAMGGGCAVLAAADDPRIKAVATLTPAETRPSAFEAATRVTVPGLHIAAGEDLLAPAVANAQPLTRAWGGPVQLRTVKKANHLSFTDGRHWTELVLHGKSQHSAQRTAKALLTAFFLQLLAGDRRGASLLSSNVGGSKIDQALSRGDLTG